MSLKYVKEQISRISSDIDKTIADYDRVYDTIRKRGRAIHQLLDGHSAEPEIGQRLQNVLTSIDNSKLLVRTQASKLEKYKMDNLGGY